MMAVEQPRRQTEAEERAGPPLGKLTLAFATTTVILFAVGVASGVIASTVERGAIRPLGVAALVGALAVAAGGGWLLRRLIEQLRPPAASPKITKARKMVLISGALGGLIGMAMVLVPLATGAGDPLDPYAAFTNGPLPAWFAIALLAIWVVLVPAITWQWHRNIDEHEARSYRDGTLAAAYAYAAIAPSWWIAWRGGFAPEPQEMPTFAAVLTVWGLVWAWRRFR